MDTGSNGQSWDLETPKSNRSFRSNDKLFKCGDSGRVFSEKCLLNHKNYFMFKGSNMTFKEKMMKFDRLNLKKEINRSVDNIQSSKNGNFPNKSVFFSSCKFDNSERLENLKNAAEYSNK